MAADLDPRVHPYREDLAASSLMGDVKAARFVEPNAFQVNQPVLNLVADRDATGLASQLLFGEVFDVYEDSGEWAWGQSKADGYVGYVSRSGLGETRPVTHRVTALSAHLYEDSNFKKLPLLSLSMGSEVHATGRENDFLKTPDGYLSEKHVADNALDFVSQAARFLGVPYLWGGRSSFGLDCSGLVQLALMAVGEACPRDSDMQMAQLGRMVEERYMRGDLLFWKGHVGIMFDEATLLHANVHHMCVAFEPVVDAIERIAKTDGPVLAHKRL